MEIIHLILGKGNPERMNGVNKVVNELATRQVISGEKAEIWGMTANPVHDYPERNYRTRLFKTVKNPFRLDPTLKTAILKKKKNGVFHLHGGFVPAMYSAAMWMKKNDIPFVFTPHGSYNVIAMQRSWFAKKVYFKLFESRLLTASRAVHSLGKSEIAGLKTVFANNKSVLIPYGFEVSTNLSAHSNRHQFIVGYCGRLDIYTKGLKELLEGFQLFRINEPFAKLWLIGDGPEKGKLIKMAEHLNLADSIVFHGSKFGEEKNALLRQCTIFAAPSRNEGLPTAVLEAASMGVPCLAIISVSTMPAWLSKPQQR